ncbi:hypothetical protein AGMMS49928_16130 [Spirochaetia bacterium]|nr:hypothetical protein AGMMS49928_16130 [Spirochaetia bacterium]
MDLRGNSTAFWQGGEVRKIIRNEKYWAILSDRGILVSADLGIWESRNLGLPVRTIKNFQDGQKNLIRQAQELKGLAMDPANPDIMVTAVKDAVYLSRDAGRNWENIGLPPFRTNGIKAVAAASMPELTVFCSHGVYGVYYYQPDKKGARWTALNTGLEKLTGTDNPDEVSDFAVVMPAAGSVQAAPEIYVSQTFRPRLYRLDWAKKTFIPIWSGGADFGTTDSLDPGKETLRFIREGEILEMPMAQAAAGTITEVKPRRDLYEMIRNISSALAVMPNCILFLDNPGSGQEYTGLSELWLLEQKDHPQMIKAGNRDGIYLPVNHAMDSRSLAPYLRLMEERKLNMAVIDMKDDYGRLRFTPVDTSLTEKGRVFRPVDIDAFLKDMKARRIYTAARIVVFKDPELAKKENGRYAIWDSRANKPWVGYYDTKQPKGTGNPKDSNYKTEVLSSSDPASEVLRTYYDETWVDPYSETVWDYIVSVAKELADRGFDEIQFDYIRFPTDGVNLGDARYRWKDSEMDMDSAIISFLRHARSRLPVPISVDIYGANGWYRTGARTGQEVELLAPYVDVISPMYYPSHFEQDFLAQAPAIERPYRIYFQGTQRTARIARNQVIVRPYVQAFFLNVSYDRRFYNPEYVLLESRGVRDAGRGGMTYWNNSGRYDDIPLPADLEKKVP